MVQIHNMVMQFAASFQTQPMKPRENPDYTRTQNDASPPRKNSLKKYNLQLVHASKPSDFAGKIGLWEKG